AFDDGLEVFVLALPPISAHAEEAAQSAGPARVVLASLSRRRFHGGFHAYLLLLIDWWGPLSHRPSATKPITSHEAVWPSQGQPCSVPGSYWLVILDIGIEIAKTLDRSDHDRDLVAQLRATAGGNCQLLPMSLRLATICTGSALDAVGHSEPTEKSL